MYASRQDLAFSCSHIPHSLEAETSLLHSYEAKRSGNNNQVIEHCRLLWRLARSLLPKTIFKSLPSSSPCERKLYLRTMNSKVLHELFQGAYRVKCHRLKGLYHSSLPINFSREHEERLDTSLFLWSKALRPLGKLHKLHSCSIRSDAQNNEGWGAGDSVLVNLPSRHLALRCTASFTSLPEVLNNWAFTYLRAY